MRVVETLPELCGAGSRVADPEFSLYQTFDDAGLEIDHADEIINVRLASEREARLLGIELPAAVMLVHRQSFDDAGRLMELVEAVYLQHTYTYDARLVRQHKVAVLDGGGAPGEAGCAA